MNWQKLWNNLLLFSLSLHLSGFLVGALAETPQANSSDLWNQGIEAFMAQKYQPATQYLSQYLEKFPGGSQALDARFYLGKAYLLSRQAEKSVSVLQSFIESAGSSPQINEARQYLGDAYLDLKKYTEAYLVSEEFLLQKDLSTHWKAKALLLRAQAQNALQQTIEAKKSLMSFQAIAEKDPELEKEIAESYLASLELKSWECKALPHSPTLPEDQLLDQLSKKGLCVLEMGTYFLKTSQSLSQEKLSEAFKTLQSVWKEYQSDCQTPGLARSRMTQKQWKTALQEITQKLQSQYQGTETLMREMLITQPRLKDFAHSLTKSK